MRLLVEESCEDLAVTAGDGDDAIVVNDDPAENNGKGKSRSRMKQPIMEVDDGGVRLQMMDVEIIPQRNNQGDHIEADTEVPTICHVDGLDNCTSEGMGAMNKGIQASWEARSFSVYDVALFIGLPTMGKIIEFAEDDMSMTKLAKIIMLCMAQHCVKVIKKLLDANNELDKLGLWLSLYAWMVMSGVMFPRTPYRATWSMQKYVEDIYRMGEYAWVNALWRAFVEAMEEMQ
ncbi:hypothetical protein Cgig2_005518 [Carnegiea gigantea]|uniref:Uncharacterized protein n=1 Tax=Carnegiea gigantea TaxID=171969 RepID=A0A9Q1Q6K7_9CARY|nr:hypothetical protein Cgig2_005518 [Carnegiea gigantea]